MLFLPVLFRSNVISATFVDSTANICDVWTERLFVVCPTDRGHVDLADDLVAEREKSKLLQEEMEATLHDIQNM